MFLLSSAIHVCVCAFSLVQLFFLVQCCSLLCLLLCFHWMSLNLARRPVSTVVPIWSAVHQMCFSTCVCVCGRVFFLFTPLCNLCTSFHLVFVQPLAPFLCFHSPPLLSSPPLSSPLLPSPSQRNLAFFSRTFRLSPCGEGKGGVGRGVTRLVQGGREGKSKVRERCRQTDRLLDRQVRDRLDEKNTEAAPREVGGISCLFPHSHRHVSPLPSTASYNADRRRFHVFFLPPALLHALPRSPAPPLTSPFSVQVLHSVAASQPKNNTSRHHCLSCGTACADRKSVV